MNLNQVTLNVSDIARSVAFYKKLGLLLIVLDSHYARFLCPEGDATFSLHASDAPIHNTDVVIYFECKDLKQKVNALSAQGMTFETDAIIAQPWLWQEIVLRDPDGHRICLYFAGENRKDPPWRLSSA